MLCLQTPSYSLHNSLLLEHLSNIASSNSRYLVICGDFNCPEISWTDRGISLQNCPLAVWSLNHFLSQSVLVPTRPASQSILDLIFSTVSTPLDEVSVNECFGLSDHCLITFNIVAPFVISPTIRKVPVYAKAKWRLYRKILMKCSWPVNSACSVSEIWNAFRSNITYASSAAVPVSSKRRWNPTNSAKVRTAIRKHRRLYASCQQNPSIHNHMRLQSAALNLKNIVLEETCRHEAYLANSLSRNPKPFWSYVRSKTLVCPPISCVRDNSDELRTDPGAISELFSSHFSSIFKSDSFVSPSFSHDCKLFFEKIHFSPQIVHDCIQSLPATSSCDHDNLCYLLLKKGGLFLASKLSDFFNLSMHSSTYPDSWRTVLITPVHKSGKRDVCANYRPIAITSCVSRVMERIVSCQLTNFLNENCIIHPSQHGFRARSSVETAGLVHLNRITSALDKKLFVDVLYLDFAKAFDTVPHSLLKEKLWIYGIRGLLHAWISDYLSNRSQIVIVNGTYSRPTPITSGVVQGSVLGPLLFSLFINDVDECVSSSSIIKYADDIKLTICYPKEDGSQSKARDLQHDLAEVYFWSSHNGLSLNFSKCKVMHFGVNNPCFPYVLDNVKLDNVPDLKDLGVVISKSCSFKEHISLIVSKANRFLGIINRTFVTKNRRVFLTLYKSHIRSILEYCSILWCPYHVTLSERVEAVQRRFTRFFPELRPLQYRDRLAQLNLLSLYARRLRYKLIYMFKIVNRLTSFNPDDIFSFSPSPRGHSLKIIPISSVRDCRRYFFFVDVIFTWNDLYESEINVESVAQFKRSVSLYFRRKHIW